MLKYTVNFTGCGHCKKAKPEFMEAAQKFVEDSKVLACGILVDYDCSH